VALKSIGFEVIEASDGIAALKALGERAGEVRAVLLDLTMPGKSGQEIMADLRQICPDVPLLLISGYDEKQVSAELAGMKVSGFLQKPFSLEAIRAAIRSVLEV
jgi:CheY-like chemotaxis protein